MDKFAVFVKYYAVGKSSPVLCMLDLLSEVGEVDLFVQDADCLTATVLERPNVNLIELESTHGSGLLHLAKVCWRKVKEALLGKPAPFPDRGYRAYVTFDPHGFLLCRELFPAARPFYYSLELYLRDDHFNLTYPEEEMARERREINLVKGLFIQSREREAIFRQEYQLPASIPTFILPVTYLPGSERAKSELLRERFQIAPHLKIALHLGGIQEYFSCIELAQAFSKVPGWVLIFHGYHFGEYVDTLKAAIAQGHIDNVFVSTDTFELMEEMDAVVASCDLGVAWYNDVSINFTTSGKSSGKISAYLRFGLPVITKRYPSTADAVELSGCGVCVEDFPEIPAAVRQIENDYERYAQTCRAEYDRVYCFENYRAGLLEFLDR